MSWGCLQIYLGTIYKTLGIAVNICPPQENFITSYEGKGSFLFSGERMGMESERKIQSLSFGNYSTIINILWFLMIFLNVLKASTKEISDSWSSFEFYTEHESWWEQRKVWKEEVTLP